MSPLPQYAGGCMGRYVKPFCLLFKPLSAEAKKIFKVNTAHIMLLLAMEYSILQVHVGKDEKNDMSVPSKGS